MHFNLLLLYGLIAMIGRSAQVVDVTDLLRSNAINGGKTR
jgi:hypothetical protein